MDKQKSVKLKRKPVKWIPTSIKLEEYCRQIRVLRKIKFAPVKAEMAEKMGISSAGFSQKIKSPEKFRLDEMAKVKEYLKDNGIDVTIDEIFLTRG